MPSSRPPIFDDGGGLPDVVRPGPIDPGRHDRGHDDLGQEPNYLIRRGLVIGVGVLVVAGAAVGVGRLLGGGSNGPGPVGGSSEWNTLVAVDDNVGTVVLTNAAGEDTNRFRLGVAALLDAAVVDTTLIASSAEAVAIVQLDKGAEILPADVIKIDIESAGPLVRPSGSAQTVIAVDASAQRAVMVHGPTGDVFDTAGSDEVPGARYEVQLARADPSGRNVLVTDAGNFQSVLFSFDRDAPSFFPGLALAVSDSIVVTAQNVGSNANVSVFDFDEKPTVSAQTTSVRAGMVSDGKVILVGVEGQVQTLALGSGDIDEVGTLNVGTVESGHVALRGDRLVVTGSEGTAIVDDEGSVIVELPGARPTATGIDALAPRRSACLIVGRAAAGEVAVVSLEDGAILSEALASTDVLAPVDGCQPVVPTSAGFLAMDLDGVVPSTITGDVVSISPDGATLVVESANRVLLQPRASTDGGDDAAAAPIDVGRSGRTIFFAQL